jgi:CRP-like cAMP-binding protein
MEAIRDMTTIVTDPAPSVVTWNYTERGIEYWARIFTTLFHQRDRVDGECRDRIWYALARHGITMPGIQQNLRFARRPKPNARRATEQRRYRVLSNVDFLRELSDDALVRLAEHSKSRLYGAGEKLIRQGECTSELFVLTRGSVRISKRLDDEKEIELATLVAPAVLGEMCLLTGEPRSATATTLEPTRCLVIDKQALAPILTEAPTLVSKISQVITDRHAKNKLIADSHSEPAEGDDSDLLGSIKRFFGLDE